VAQLEAITTANTKKLQRLDQMGPVKKLTGFRLFWAMMWARAYPRLIGLRREPSWLVFETILPLMATMAYVFVYRALKAPDDYVGFVVFGGAMTAFWLNVLWSMATQLYWDKDAGNLELYIVAPGPIMAVLLGMAIGGIFMASIRAIIVLTVCSLVFNVTYQIDNIFLVFAIFVLTMAALYGMGMLLASVFLAAGREAWHTSNLLQEPIYLASGFYFPVKALGAAIATFASLIPLTLGMDAMRQLMFKSDPPVGFLPVPVEAAGLVVLAIVFFFLARFALLKLEEIGRREGRLIERRR
jgi:ABC-2 type transport system permease protein